MSEISRRVWPGLILLTFLSYFQFPGHIYLESDTQIYIPMFERFRDPGLFARDPMVVRSHTAFTLYDELVLGLERLTGLGFEAVLGAIHFLVRLSLFAGIFLITRAMGLSATLAFACAGIYALGGRVNGPAVLLVEYEPVPRAFALGPLLLAVGLAAHRRHIAAALAGTAAFLLHPTTAAPFWIVYAALLFVPDDPKEMKTRLWGLAPLAVAVVGLKVAANLQLSVTEPQAFLARVDEAWEKLIRLRAPYVLVTLWPPAYLWQYVLMLLVAAAAYMRLRVFIQPALRFFVIGLSALGVLSLPFSFLLLEKLKWGMMPQAQPLRTILFVELFALLLCLVMAFELACRERRFLGAVWWAGFGLAIGIQSRLLFVLAPLALAWLIQSRWRWLGLVIAGGVAWSQPFGLAVWRGTTQRELIVTLVLSSLLVAAASLTLHRRVAGTLAVAAAVVAAFFLIPGGPRFRWSGQPNNPELHEVSRWARQQTHRDSVFLFADAGRGIDPGIFRARSARAVYVDWKAGGQVNFFREFSRLWWLRWEEAMGPPFRPERLPQLRDLGIDYVVLSGKVRPDDRRPVFESGRYAVYKP